MKKDKMQIISEIAEYASNNLTEPFLLLCKDGENGCFMCNAETEDEVVGLSSNVNFLLGKYGSTVTEDEDYRTRIAFTEMYTLLKDKKIHPGAVVDMIAEGAPYIFLRLVEETSFGPVKSVAADGTIDGGADEGNKTMAMYELLLLTLSSFIQTLCEGENAVCETPVHAMAFIQATLNSIVEANLNALKAEGEVPACFDLKDVGSNPIEHTKLGQACDDNDEDDEGDEDE